MKPKNGLDYRALLTAETTLPNKDRQKVCSLSYENTNIYCLSKAMI